MRLYGTLQELTSLVIRLASGKTVKIQADEQTAAGETVINIPNAVDGVDTVVLVDTQQTLTQKTLTAPTVTSLTLSSSVIIQLPAAAPAAGQNAFGRVYVVSETEGPRLRIGSSTTDNAFAQVVTTLSSDQFQNKTINAISNTLTEIDPAASFRIIEANADKVVKYNSAGIPLVSKIVDTNIDAAAAISGSKLADGTVGAAKLSTLSSADLAGKVTDETGSGSPVFATSPTLTTPSIAQINTPAQSLAISGTGALTLPAGNNSAQRPGTPTNGMIRYNSTDNTFEGYSNGAWAGIGGGGTTDKVTQASHGFVLGDVLYLNGSTYAKAIASAANTAEVVGVVSRVIDTSTFEMTLSGEISGLAGLVAGEVYFLSAATAGLLTVTEPSVVGQVSLPVGVASSATTLYVAPKRGVVVGAANARTTISINNAAVTPVVDVTNYNSLKLEGELFVSRTGGNQRAYYTVEAAKNGAGVWQVSASYTGDDILYVTLPSWDVAANQLQITMPLVTGPFLSASLTYALNAPAVGASLPLSVDSSSLNIVADAPLSYRNVLINGNFDVWQRGTSQANMDAGFYLADRWRVPAVGSSRTSSQQSFTVGQTDVPGNPKFFHRTIVSSVAGAGNLVAQAQRVEGVHTFAGQTVTISFWAKADANKNIAISYVQHFGGGGSPSASVNTAAQKIAVTSSWQKFSISTDIPSIVGKTLGTAGGDYLQATFWFDAGTNFNSETSSLGQQSGTFDISGVQLEVGSKASAFERRPYGMELGMCQRYYYRITSSTVYGPFGVGAAKSATGVDILVQYPVPLRVVATVVDSSAYSSFQASDAITSTAVTNIGIPTNQQTTLGAVLGFTVASGLTTFRPMRVEAANTVSAYLGFSAEL